MKLIYKKMRIVLAILRVSDYNKIPKRRMYWKLSDVRNTTTANAILGNRLLECLRHLYFAENEPLDTNNRYAEVRTLFTDQNQR